MGELQDSSGVGGSTDIAEMFYPNSEPAKAEPAADDFKAVVESSAKVEKADDQGPESYDHLKIPESLQADDKAVAELRQFAQGHGLSAKQCQATLSYASGLTEKATETVYKSWTERNEKWITEAQAQFTAHDVRVAQAVFIPGRHNPLVGTAAEGEALKRALEHTGAGNNPAMIRLFVKVGRYLQARGEARTLKALYSQK